MFVLLTILSALIATMFVASVVATIHELKRDSADKGDRPAHFHGNIESGLLGASAASL
jgi:hypothetical protein